MKISKCLAGVLVAVVLSLPAYAWDGGTDTAKVRAKADTAKSQAGGGYVVLVALHAERNRIAEAKRRGDMELLGHIQEDAEEIRKRTIKDFTDNFHRYPVYFVMDTLLDQIIKGRRDGVLTNADGSKVTVTPPSFSGGKFVIAYYTKPDMQYIGEDVITDTDRWVDQARFLGHALVLYNNKFQQFNSYRKRALAKLDANEEQYYYKSKVADMEYYPLAERMDARAERRRGVSRFFGF